MRTKTIALMLAGVFSAGCAVKPVPLTEEDIRTRMESDLSHIFDKQEPVSGAISLWEAMSRALKYNLDHRVKLMEVALAGRILDSTNYSMLPQLALDAGYYARNNYSGGISQSLLTGRQSLEPSTSQEKIYTNVGLHMVWNVLDFGVSHVVAEQKATDVLITHERRRRVIQNILSDVYDAYWRAVAAERLLAPIEELLAESKKALANSKAMENSALQNPRVALLYQRNILDNLRRLRKMREELTISKIQLAALISLPLNTNFKVEVVEQIPPVDLKLSLQELETIALTNQPELREEDYKTRQKVLEVKKAMRRMWPGLEISIGGDYNSNKFLYNQDWYGSSLRLSWNLLNLFTGGPAAKREAEAHVDLANQRRMALSMAILTQVWVSYQRYHLAKEDYELAEQLSDINSKLDSLTKKTKQASAGNQLNVVLSSTDELVTRMSRDVVFAEVQSALAKVYHTIGIDPLPTDIMMQAPISFENYSVADLAKKIETHITASRI